MWGILFATKELDDPLNDPSQGASRPLGFLDPVVCLLSFFGLIVDGFVAFFSAHAHLHSLARRVLSRRLSLWGIRRDGLSKRCVAARLLDGCHLAAATAFAENRPTTKFPCDKDLCRFNMNVAGIVAI